LNRAYSLPAVIFLHIHACYLSLIAVIGCHSIFKAGFAYFSVANLTQAVYGKYLSAAFVEFRGIISSENYPAAFRIFFLTPGGG